MTKETNDLITTLLLLCYNFMLLAGTAYLVIMFEWSAWWFLLTVFLLATKRTSDAKE